MDLEKQLRMLAEQTRDHALLLMDVDGRIQWINEAAEAILGLDKAAAVGQPLAILFPKEDVKRGLPEAEIHAALTHGAGEDDRWVVRSDGSRFWATGVSTVLRDEGGKAVAIGKILRNRTDLREQLNTLHNQASAAVEASHRKDVFLSTLSHELRNPLAPLLNAVHLIRLAAPDAPALEAPLRIVERQVDNMRRLVDDLLDLTRIGAGKVELQKTTIAMQEMVRRAVEATQAIVRQNGHELKVLAPPGPLLVDVDPARMEQVFINLINNAAKYTLPGGRIWVKCTSEGEEVVVHIEDNGVGIPHDMLPRIFDLFTQVEALRPQSQGGLGIGLALVKNLVSLHGGTVQVRSEGPGKGAEFSVRLPVSKLDPSVVSGTVHPPAHADRSSVSQKTLGWRS